MQGVQDKAANVISIKVSYDGTISELERIRGGEVREDAEKYEEHVDFYYPETMDYYQMVTVEFTDPKEIAEIGRALVFNGYASSFGPYPSTDGYFTAEVSMKTDTGVTYGDEPLEWSERYHFTEGGVPQFVIDRILKELGE